MSYRLKLLAQAVALVVLTLAAVVMIAAKVDWADIGSQVILSIPMDQIEEVRYDRPNDWVSEATAGVPTSVVQRFAMRSVLIDIANADPKCREYSWALGVAFPAERLVCVNPRVWGNGGSLHSYHTLSHELAHIALGEFGAVRGGHGDDHFDMTLLVMDRLMDYQGVPDWKRSLAVWSIGRTRGYCQRSDIC